MAETASLPLVSLPNKMATVKVLAESPGLSSIPSTYTFPKNESDKKSSVSDTEYDDNLIPVIDFSLLTSSSPEVRSIIINDLREACQKWGFFKKSRRENLKESIFNLPPSPVDSERFQKSIAKEPERMARELLKGISESLGLEASYIDKTLNLNSGLQLLIANLYPPCPQPDLAMGLPPHSDHGLLTLLTQNGIGGLQLQHNSKWVNVDAPPNSFLVNTGDHIEILSNGKYKSVVHRAIVNNKSTRISLAIANGPSLDTVVCPAQELIDN
ncbi:hypothetical protein Patl1_37161 [Pistacia atlantica]|nr:hypothetical protein Patl1_37161 [Pistacia atlantica]